MSTVTRAVSSFAVARASRPHALVDVFQTVLIPLLAVGAGAIHLVHNYLPMSVGSRPAVDVLRQRGAIARRAAHIQRR